MVVASEAIYVRNLADTVFPEKFSADDAISTRKRLIELLGETVSDLRFWDTDNLTRTQIDYLIERLSAPKELSKDKKCGAGILIKEDESVWLAINTTDSIRLRVGIGGNDIEKCYRSSRKIEEDFEERVPFAYSERYGFLTSRPTECGTGLILRFIVHIPGIIFMSRFVETRDVLQKLGSTLKTMPDEAMSSEGHIFALQNKKTLGIDEEGLLRNAKDSIDELLEREYDSRNALLEKAKYQMEDRVMRGIGVLTHARMISKEEGFALANALRFGSAEGNLRESIDLVSATELYFVGQPAHLVNIAGEGDSMELDANRAELFRTYFRPEDL